MTHIPVGSYVLAGGFLVGAAWVFVRLVLYLFR